ncbi:uncharacterized protein [Antedon mediterranea]|uniref:uncharacterized protein isoform X2 n=1 Tax=Antedon mediterranea TaxID=105859 RepID=UPI003AF6A486
MFRYIQLCMCLTLYLSVTSMPTKTRLITKNKCSEDIRLDNITRNSLIVKAAVRKVENNILKVKVQKEFTTKGLKFSSIEVFSQETILDACGSKIMPDNAYLFFIVAINDSNTEFELQGPVYHASKQILRKIRKIAAELEATTLAASAKTVVQTTATTLLETATSATTDILPTTTIAAIETVLNPMSRPCVKNLLTCYNGGTCYEVADRPHCICTTGRKGPQCELFDVTLTFESTSTDDSFLDFTEAMIAIGVIFVITLLLIVLGVYIYLKHRKSIEQSQIKEDYEASYEDDAVTNGRRTEAVHMLSHTKTSKVGAGSATQV